ncbi:MAG TPA: tetratricopeptide repeat protein [Polyangia bacterium]|nr:tetratricopeptide repeat protein [Polyangia bacterium]
MRALQLSFVLATLTSLTATAALADELGELAQAIDQSPDDARTYDAYASAALKQKRWDDAIRRLKVGVARIPDYAEGYYKLAYAYRQKHEWADAADYYRRYTVLNPSRTDTYYGLGAALEGMGDKRGAIAAFDKYVALEKSPAKQHFVDSAKAELAKMDPSRGGLPPVDFSAPPTTNAPGTSAPATNGPPAADAASLRAQAEDLRKANRLPEAAAAYKRAIAADRGNLDLYNDLGNVYFALKQYGDAANAFSDATKRDPSYALGWYNLAHALRKGDHAREAADAYRQYIKLKPDDPDPYYGLGQTLKMMGDTPGAIIAFKKYIGMEKRPEEQKWVDKASVELQALEAMQQQQPRRAPEPSGKIEEKSTLGDDTAAARTKLDQELKRDAVLPPSEDDMRLIDPFANGRLRDLKDPFHRAGDEIVNPFESAPSPTAERIRQYGAALAAYRRALARHAEDVSLRFERGVASALAANSTSALKTWNAVPLEDPEVAEARRSVERIRSQLLSRR